MRLLSRLGGILNRLFSPASEGSVRSVDEHRSRYAKLLRCFLTHGFAREKALRMLVGGDANFEAVGLIERALLVQFGLLHHHRVVDVGCGCGRLAAPLAEYLSGRYLGTDILPDLLKLARRSVGRPDWRFELARDLSVPEADGVADFVCFFSVFTHLQHTESYRYLLEAARVLRPGGKVVVSFLEYACPAHWDIFKDTYESMMAGAVLPPNVFLSRDAITAWAQHAGLRPLAVHAGNEQAVNLPSPVQLSDGSVIQGSVNFGQSFCVLEKPPIPAASETTGGVR